MSWELQVRLPVDDKTFLFANMSTFKNVKFKVHKNITSFAAVYGCGTGSRPERTQIENKVLREILGPKREKVTEEQLGAS
jgi:hypothetical protein